MKKTGRYLVVLKAKKIPVRFPEIVAVVPVLLVSEYADRVDADRKEDQNAGQKPCPPFGEITIPNPEPNAGDRHYIG